MKIHTSGRSLRKHDKFKVSWSPELIGYINTMVENQMMGRWRTRCRTPYMNTSWNLSKPDTKREYGSIILMSQDVLLLVHKVIDSKPRRKASTSYAEYSPSIFPSNG
jgi:hypothetical protein